ncbi:MAG: cytidine/deoxycytidylate deaminase family protein [Coriobacteriales bacterium]|nr:cytidine/deoxycytidylate deaminase family protein [Coriobacteriales bacterium]
MSDDLKNYIRPSWDEYFFSIVNEIETRSTCIRRHVGALLVKDKRIIASGYNGCPTGLSHCSDVGCIREKLGIPSGQQHELCRGVHAEQNAITQAARYGVSIDGATLYCNTQPCTQCTKMLINAGVKEIVFKNPYPDKLAQELLAESDIIVRQL